MISSHDLLDDRKLKAEVDAEVLQIVNEASGEAANEGEKERSLANLKAAVAAVSKPNKNVRSAVEQSDDIEQPNATKTEKFVAGSSSKKKNREEYTKLREELRISKKAVPLLMGEEAKKLEKDRAFQDMLTPLQQQRQKYLQRKKASNRTAREQDTLSKLKKFQATLIDVNAKKTNTSEDADKAKKDAESYHGQVLEDDDDDDTNDDKSWMTAKLKFKKHIDVSSTLFFCLFSY
ncbi:Thioredoxin domain-containing protein 9 [Phytophthora nicotianae]|nr:Thioredoxin domain-containing protein 9 [Phytophthora nicotianae]